jgi:integrase
MACVIKRKKSQYFIACYTDRDGRQLKRSTKTTDRHKALEIALELERVERLANQGQLITTQLTKVLDDVSKKVTGDSLIAPTVEKYLEEWLNGIRARNTKATLERYKNVVKVFIASLGEKAKKPITFVTAHDVESFLNQRLNFGIAPTTATIDLKIINMAFRRAESYGTIIKNPVAVVKPPKGDGSEREVFTQEEVQKLLNVAPNVEWQTLILLGFFVGARLQDCVHMKWENVHPDDGVIVYNQQKTGKKVVIPMHYHVLDHLNHIATFGTEGFLCPKLATKGPGGKHGLSESFKRILVKAKVDPMTVQGKGIRRFSKRTFHSLRHSFNSSLANAGVSEEIRMKLTGHSSKEMNNIYTHHEVSVLKNAVNSLPLFNEQT